MTLTKLDRRTKAYWLSISIFISIIIIAPVTLFLLSLDKPVLNALLLPIGLPTLLLVALIISIPFIRYHFYSYGFDEKHVLINYGFIFKHKITIPVCQIQDLHIIEGPIMMLFKISGVIFSTAGSNYTLPGINKDRATQMVETIEEYLNKRVKEKANEEVL